MIRQNDMMASSTLSSSCSSESFLVVEQFIETMDLLLVQGPNNNKILLGDYLRADGPIQGKHDSFDPAFMV
jgi:hypothetical protein